MEMFTRQAGGEDLEVAAELVDEPHVSANDGERTSREELGSEDCE